MPGFSNLIGNKSTFLHTHCQAEIEPGYFSKKQIRERPFDRSLCQDYLRSFPFQIPGLSFGDHTLFRGVVR